MDPAQVEVTVLRVLQDEGDLFAFQVHASFHNGALTATIEFADVNVASDFYARYNSVTIEVGSGRIVVSLSLLESNTIARRGSSLSLPSTRSHDPNSSTTSLLAQTPRQARRSAPVSMTLARHSAISRLVFHLL